MPQGTDDAHVIKGETLADLAARRSATRLEQYASRIGEHGDSPPDFEKKLKATIKRFNGFAKAGKDLDFHRGERQVELLFNGPAAEEPAAPNPTMYPDLGARARTTRRC